MSRVEHVLNHLLYCRSGSDSVPTYIFLKTNYHQPAAPTISICSWQLVFGQRHLPRVGSPRPRPNLTRVRRHDRPPQPRHSQLVTAQVGQPPAHALLPQLALASWNLVVDDIGNTLHVLLRHADITVYQGELEIDSQSRQLPFFLGIW